MSTITAVHRLTLDCGHIAVALHDGEERRRGRNRPCYACGKDGVPRMEKIVTTEAVTCVKP